MHLFSRKKEANGHSIFGAALNRSSSLRSLERPIRGKNASSIGLRASRSRLFKKLGIAKGSANSNQSKRDLVGDLDEQNMTSQEDAMCNKKMKDSAHDGYFHDGAADSASDLISSDSWSFDLLKEPRDFSSLRSPVEIPCSGVNEQTVVQRPKMRCMLSVFDDEREDETVFPSSSLSPEPMSPANESSSTRDESTARTSVPSDFTSETILSANGKEKLIEKTQIQNRLSLHDTELHEYNSCLNGIFDRSDVILRATISTVEATSAAKAFFEIHYSDLLSTSGSPRSIRRHKFEQHLLTLDLPYSEMQEAKENWCRGESDYLRKSRIFKAKSMARYSRNGCTVDHFEDVRVLGKGSFGVVRLVREREDSFAGDYSTSNRRHLPRYYPKDLAGIAYCDPARKRAPGKMYAMKVIRKSHMLRNCQEAHLRAERDFLVASQTSKWIVPLHTSFQDYSNLYLVMEFMIGGDFLTYLLREDVLDEAAARWYIAEMILCIEEIHRMNWIHRDVKPDNFLISPSGHLKISDFGLAFDGHWSHNQAYYHNHRYSLAERLGIRIFGDSRDSLEDDMYCSLSSPCKIKRVQGQNYPILQNNLDQIGDETLLQWRDRTQRRNHAKSIVGTSQYMAPEVVRGEPYDGRCDWWSVGIILYESLYGRPPFFGEDRATTKEIIKHHALYLRFPNESRIARPTSADRSVLPPVSREAIDLISRLLRRKELRLCSLKYADKDRVVNPNRQASRSANQQYMGFWESSHFAYADDAEDIKAHTFFYGIRWKSLHRDTPPFVPRVQHDIAEYFESEKELLSDMSDDESDSDYEETAWYPNDVGLDKAGAASPFARWVALETWDLDGANGEMQQQRNAQMMKNKMKKQKKQQKRPRDKILRDPMLYRAVMDVRKKGAFLGYTYRRPRAVGLSGMVRRQPNTRRSIPTFGS